MPVVTLTSDLGTADYQIAAVKGVLLGAHEQLNIIDITHSIKPFHYIDAAYVLENCFRDFPLGTIHIVGVEGDFLRRKEWLIAKLDDHYFFTKNNGLLSLISSQEPQWVYQLNIESKQQLKFPMRSLLAAAAVKFLKGTKPEELGIPIEKIIRRRLMQPSIGSNSITGVILRITPYNNATTNIHRRDFESFTGLSSCKIHYNKMDYFDKIHNSYHDLPEGVAGCFFGFNGYLELGIHGGNAKNLLSFIEGKNIRIEFE
ncbi:MAG: SAM-dependent chlorinase/fluorinase [Bacteroidia bacterium]